METYLIDNTKNITPSIAPLVKLINGGTAQLNRSLTPPRPAMLNSSETLTSGCYNIDNSTYKVVSSLKGEVCDNETVIKQKTSLVGIKVIARTEEQLKRGEENYKYNDTWAFMFNIDNITYQDGGFVQKSYTSGGIGGINGKIREYEFCYDVGLLTENKTMTLKTRLMAQDVGDGNNPTSIQLIVSNTCANITKFENTETQKINKSEVYLFGGAEDTPTMGLVSNNSSKLVANYSKIKIPTTISYVAPKNSKLLKVKLDLQYGNNESIDLFSNMTNFLEESGLFTKTTSTNKNNSQVVTYKSSEFVLPAINNLLSIYNKISDINNSPASFIRLKLNIDFEDTVTQRRISASHYFKSQNGHSKFVPVFDIKDIYSDHFQDDSRRYSNARDVAYGEDAWGQKSTIDWLIRTNLRFDDIGPLHGARHKTGDKDVLGHRSHGNGKAIDVRYANPVDNLSQTLTREQRGLFSTINNNTTATTVLHMIQGFNLQPDNFNYDKETYADLGSEYLNGKSNGTGIFNLGNKAHNEAKALNYALHLDNISALPNKDDAKFFIMYTSWVLTNRIAIEYYKAKIKEAFGGDIGMKIYTGNHFEKDNKTVFIHGNFQRILSWGGFPNSNYIDIGLGGWSGSTAVNPHHHHWHITLPNKEK